MISNNIQCLITQAFVMVSVLIAAPASGQVTNEDLRLFGDKVGQSDQFGSSVAIDNGFVAVGSPGYDDNIQGNGIGTAYLFDASTGTQLFRFQPADLQASANFGTSVAIDNGIVAIGAISDGGDTDGIGSVYLFDANTGMQLFKLSPDDGQENDRFGRAVAMDNGIVAVGSVFHDENGSDSGSAYLFDATTGLQIAKLNANDISPGDRFGWSIAIDNGVVAVGAVFDDDNGNDSGSAYLFDVATGMQTAKLVPSDGSQGQWFGWSISVHNGVVAVGASKDNDNGIDSGSAYLFDASTGAELVKLLPTNGLAGDSFGTSISINDGTVVVGASFSNILAERSGSSYLFEASTGNQLTRLAPTDNQRRDFFGTSVDIQNSTVVCGALSPDGILVQVGATYIFTAPSLCNIEANLNGDFELDFFDISVFLGLFQNQSNTADWNNDNQWDFFDISGYLQSYQAGCP